MVGLVYLCLFYLLNQIYLLVLWPHKELALASWTVVSPQIEHKMIQNYTTFWSTAIAGSEIRSIGLKLVVVVAFICLDCISTKLSQLRENV